MGVGRRAFGIVRIWPAIQYSPKNKKLNKSYLKRVRTNQKTEKSRTKDHLSTSQEFSGSGYLCFISICVLFVSHSGPIFLQAHFTHEPVCLTWPSSGLKLINPLSFLWVTWDMFWTVLFTLFEPGTIISIMVLAMITTNIYWVLTTCSLLF